MFLMRFSILLLYFECCFLISYIFADTSHDLIVHSGDNHPTYIILDFLDGKSFNFVKPKNERLDIKLFKSIQNECNSSFKFVDLTGEISGDGLIENTNLALKCHGDIFNHEISTIEFRSIDLNLCISLSQERYLTFTFNGKCGGLFLSVPKNVTVSLRDLQTSILPLPSEFELDNYIYFILSNTTTKWKKNLQLNENKQWKYTVLKNVTTSMFVLDEKYPRNAIIFNAGEKRNCISSFKLNFNVPSKCDVKFLYKNQQLKLITEDDEKILNGQSFKLFFHEGKIVGIQMNPFKIIELNVCDIETTAAHAWHIHEVEEATCENTSFTFDSNVKIAVSNSKKLLPKTWKTYKSSKPFETTTTSATKTKDASLTWLWIILGIIFALILIGFSSMVFYNYCCSRKKSKSPSDELAKQYELHKRKIKEKKRQKKELSMMEPVE